MELPPKRESDSHAIAQGRLEKWNVVWTVPNQITSRPLTNTFRRRRKCKTAKCRISPKKRNDSKQQRHFSILRPKLSTESNREHQNVEN